MTLLDIVKKINDWDRESPIYAANPWTENSQALVLAETDSGEAPQEAKELGLTYFIEVFIGCDFIDDWATTLDKPPTSKQKCSRLIEFATNDA